MLLFKILTKYLSKKKYTPPALASKGEREVARVLDKYNITYIPQFKFGWMHVDFAIMIRGRICFIEFNGIQHRVPVKYFGFKSFIKTVFRDIMENLECKHQKIPILRCFKIQTVEIEILKFLKEQGWNY